MTWLPSCHSSRTFDFFPIAITLHLSRPHFSLLALANLSTLVSIVFALSMSCVIVNTSSTHSRHPIKRVKSQHQSSNPSLIPQNILSIGHRPLWGRCPSHHHTPTYTHRGAMGTADHLTLLRLFLFEPQGWD